MASNRPSPAQIELAQRIAARTGVTPTDSDRTVVKKLSTFIEANNLASPRQKEWIEKLVAEGKIKKPKGFPDRIAAADAKTTLDKTFAKPAKGAKRGIVTLTWHRSKCGIWHSV